MAVQLEEERKLLDELYDRETDFSRRKLKQVYWSKKIAADLKQLSSFE